ncbi:molybdopterin cofactor-binding domain-containing protein [Ochrobactrum vermis]|uniref:Molybdopterin cofactor-binding domain-containing protein n=1 Tax=Ochrobactrum vermis TaxID=1827297 RepID=A0ABU8PKJ5_9HYPH|nr:molybdopterin cofactor-binding domain-containing protein [Ochrobactrum vermis]PQZ26951.1 aldehyde oxidase [Ochrobactrum vermis]
MPFSDVRTTRRQFLMSNATIGMGLLVGVDLSEGSPEPTIDKTFQPNAFVRVLPDNSVQLVVHKHDSGTGTKSSLGAILAEELEVGLEQVTVVSPENPFFHDYIHPQWHVFSTGGSTSVMLEFQTLRKAGAMARIMLINAAADRWGVSARECHAEQGQVIHSQTGRQLEYGKLVQSAALMATPTDVTLKKPDEFRIIGKLTRKIDTMAKLTGEHTFGVDVKLPNMLTATIQHAPMVHGRVRTMNQEKSLAVSGVRRILIVPAADRSVLGGNQEGVAVLADSYWASISGRDQLKIEWDDGEFAGFNSADIARQQRSSLISPQAQFVRTIGHGNAEQVISGAAKTLRAEYIMPYKAQNPMEPQSVTVEIRDGKVHYWGGIQVPSNALFAARTLLGLGEENVVLHELTGGGSFGARESRHWLLEATYLARETGRPVKLMYSREDEMKQLYYHAATLTELTGAIDQDGDLLALKLRAVSPASPEEWEPGYNERQDKMDYSTTESICAWDFAYAPKHLDIGWIRHETGMPTGWYRAVSFIPNVFATESFMDEMAELAGKDPLAFRISLMSERPRHVNVLRNAAQRAGWHKPHMPGRSLGLATNQGYKSFVAIVAELEQTPKTIEIRRITCVADCGLAVHPGSVEEQLYGGIMWGLGHALFDRIDFIEGRVIQTNFDNYVVMRQSHMPDIDITVVQGDPGHPTGVGELSNPSVVPAIANALSRLTGKRQRSTPFVMA